MATTKTVTKKAPVTKTVAEPELNKEEKTIIEENVTTTEKVSVPKKFEKDDLIPCRSITPGLLLYNGVKSKIPYSWSAMNDVTYVEYQDLLAAMVMRSDYIFDPLFVIEDEDVLADPKWKEVNDLYQEMEESIDIMELINLPTNKFRKALTESPKGIQNAVKTRVASLIGQNSFDSYQKIKIIDEVCGTELILLIS